MCLAVPLKITKLNADNTATGEAGGLSQSFRVDFMPDLHAGDYVMVHAGFAISKIDEKEALATQSVLSEVANI